MVRRQLDSHLHMLFSLPCPVFYLDKFRRGKSEQHVQVRIELTANHMGHFEFRLCPNNNPAKPATQTCLDRLPNNKTSSKLIGFKEKNIAANNLLIRYLLEQSNGVGPRYFPGPGNRVFETQYQVLFKILNHFGFETQDQFWSKFFIFLSLTCFQLPKDLTCVQCVFQWRYIAANNWGEFFSSWRCPLWESPSMLAWDYVLQV